MKRCMSAMMALLMCSGASALGAVNNSTKMLMPQEGFGGIAVFCDGQAPVMLDYYYAALPTATGAADLIDIANMSIDQVLTHVRERLRATSFFEEYQWAATVLGDGTTWPLANLSHLTDDTKEPFPLPPGCHRRQAAYRLGDTVFLDGAVIRQLSPGQVGVLIVHEALYWIASKKAGHKTSEHVRALMRPLIAKQQDLSRIELLINNIGGTAWPMQKVTQGKYLGETPNGKMDGGIFFEPYDPETRVITLNIGISRARLKCDRGVDAYICRSLGTYVFIDRKNHGESFYLEKILPTSSIRLSFHASDLIEIVLDGTVQCKNRECKDPIPSKVTLTFTGP